jgi:hypothetical protein
MLCIVVEDNAKVLEYKCVEFAEELLYGALQEAVTRRLP